MGPSRISELAPEAMTAEQQATLEALQAGRGRVPTPYKIWLHSPALARAMEQLGTFLNTQSSLSAREIELATVLVAKKWHGSYVLEAHLRRLGELGFTGPELEAVRAGQSLDLHDARELAVYRIATCSGNADPIDDETFTAAVETIGHRGIAELLALIGYYSAVAVAMKTYRVPSGGSA